MQEGFKLAVFGDIHGNLPALLAALTDMARRGAEAHICLGDVAMDGAWPAECIQRIAALGCPVVRGNADRMVLEAAQPFAPRGFPDEEKLHAVGSGAEPNWAAPNWSCYSPTLPAPSGLICCVFMAVQSATTRN